ncbi:peptide chain release factor N(5)-glutamine methyltransferase [Chitinophaga polysaccharea]|uniref:peptide chain release factor N(5)-glutamine methyltransferase n=1 Tax=Chitinophaga TaxID=79328 RepID=UPI001454F7C7|nr:MULTISPECIES: peptide chain release factor N(5)-glutamine methyltransferase [Chitinophaga]NLR61321.1 peptide chain release factor N(5)-glutamine methyltransferase [Chitinophaga polysaccharea]NLU95157.1 peptide chain release factor N(5)-glutamine methyltransferase [Chitinophaga sp. Ak27]
MTIQTAFTYITGAISELYDEREAASIAHIIMEYLTGMSKLDRIVHKTKMLSPDQNQRLKTAIEALQRQEPVQYITGTGWFYGMELLVNKNVLIPRPETEELVEWIVQDTAHRHRLHLLDVGTGSGCIPLALKKSLPDAQVSAVDVSEGALEVARSNASRLRLEVNFLLMDALDPAQVSTLPSFDLIVSNPPYITQSEQQSMQEQVWGYEPSLALFVPDNDALLFYRHISMMAKQKLLPGGALYFEINEALGKEVVALMEELGFKEVTLKQDMFGKDRMVKGKLKA